MKSIQSQVLLIAALFLAAGCSKSASTGQLDPSVGIFSAPKAQTLTVVNSSGAAITNAQVLLGDGVSGPFGANLLGVDSHGSFVAPTQWTTPTSVTISAPGYVRTTFLSQVPNGQSFSLRAADSGSQFELTGQTTGYDIQDDSGIADVGLVIPTLSKEDVFNFQLGMVLSPQNDKISALGKSINVPSNLSIPTQTQTYIFPIQLSKPVYRMYVPTGGSRQIFTAHAQFPFSKVIDDAQNKVPTYQLVNDISIVGGSLKVVNVAGTTTTQDFTVNDMSFSGSGTWSIPEIASTQVILAMALNKSGNVYYPTGLHEEEQSGTGTLSMMDPSKTTFVAVLKNKSEFSSGAGSTRLSAALATFTTGMTPTFLPLLADPVASNANAVQLAATANVSGISPLASYAVLSAVQTDAQTKATTTQQLWAIYDPNWSTSYQLPTWPHDSALPAGAKRWDLTRLAVDQGPASVPMGPAIFETATHATHAAIDLKQ